MDNTLAIQPARRNQFITDISVENVEGMVSTDKPFIQANTISSTLVEMKTQHLIPVYAKDNEPLISSADFIESSMEIVADMYCGETILKPSIRLSHPIKGRGTGC